MTLLSMARHHSSPSWMQKSGRPRRCATSSETSASPGSLCSMISSCALFGGVLPVDQRTNWRSNLRSSARHDARAWVSRFSGVSYWSNRFRIAGRRPSLGDYAGCQNAARIRERTEASFGCLNRPRLPVVSGVWKLMPAPKCPLSGLTGARHPQLNRWVCSVSRPQFAPAPHGSWGTSP